MTSLVASRSRAHDGGRRTAALSRAQGVTGKCWRGHLRAGCRQQRAVIALVSQVVGRKTTNAATAPGGQGLVMRRGRPRPEAHGAERPPATAARARGMAQTAGAGFLPQRNIPPLARVLGLGCARGQKTIIVADLRRSNARPK